ncbi:hypothetical protein Lal_00021635 [Lupinus albus]|uniref:AT3G52170-like helix-turn-helix domain-containing protein n=1 Tax=Lupinus albus TaxID=3870 RepID=A0A6A4NKC4_LUPAL|nr:hypothetical protein Lalb_Chr21g0313091 [Lupinus albus]KAF1860591.1 hypothetical protein Lal_00021635 [Lupinus albus]
MMHSVKGGWAGQTFALAKRNESEGRKSRIRRSKEERKSMVESFIKKYQESNNGKFPSLSLTHKEVGGSFYTVREIVRDIIQENRVLGPAKFTSEDVTSDQFFEQNPLGSIARDPKSYLVASSYENHSEHNNLRDTSGKMVSVSDGYYTGVEHQALDQGHAMNVIQVDVINKESIEATVVSDGYYTGAEHPMVNNGHVINGSQADVTNNKTIKATIVSDFTGSEHQVVDVHVINGSRVDVVNKESNESNIPEMQVSQPMVSKENVEQELATATTQVAKVTPLTEDLIAETIPFSPVMITTDGKEHDLEELRGSINLPEKDIKMLELEHVEVRSELNGIEPTKNSNTLDEKIEDVRENQILKNNPNTGHDEEKILGDPLVGNTQHSILKEHIGHEVEECTDTQVSTKISIQDGLQAKNLTKTNTEGSKTLQDGQHKDNKQRVDGQFGDSSQRISNPTLDRINLDSWQGKPKNSAKEECNPLLAILKVFVDGFIKFWSE